MMTGIALVVSFALISETEKPSGIDQVIATDGIIRPILCVRERHHDHAGLPSLWQEMFNVSVGFLIPVALFGLRDVLLDCPEERGRGFSSRMTGFRNRLWNGSPISM